MYSVHVRVDVFRVAVAVAVAGTVSRTSITGASTITYRKYNLHGAKSSSRKIARVIRISLQRQLQLHVCCMHTCIRS